MSSQAKPPAIHVQNQAQLQPPQQQPQHPQQHQQQQAYGQPAPALDVKSEARAPQTQTRQPLHQPQQQMPVSSQQQQQQQQGAELPTSMGPLQQQPLSQAQLAFQLPGMFEGERCRGQSLPMPSRQLTRKGSFAFGLLAEGHCAPLLALLRSPPSDHNQLPWQLQAAFQDCSMGSRLPVVHKAT